MPLHIANEALSYATSAYITYTIFEMKYDGHWKY